MIEQLWTFLSSQLASNQFLAGGFILGIIAALFHQLKAIPGKIFSKLWSQFFIEVEILERDEAFGWVVKWMAEQPYSKRRARLLMAHTERAKRGPTSVDDDEDTDSRPEIIFSPARGNHWFFYKRRLVYVYRGRDEDSSASKETLITPQVVTVRILSRSRTLLKELLEEARDLAVPKKDRRISVMTYRWGWKKSACRRPRPLESVILRAGLIEEIIAAIEQFKADEKWYYDMGIPYRLGILASGPPGSGKSSLISAVASHFHLDLATVNLMNSSLDDDDLMGVLSEVPATATVLMEDIDCVFTERQKTEDNESKLSFSGLLNAIDGVAATEGRILWMTTNHPEKLDPALIRPGRADLHFHVGAPDSGQACRLFQRFFPQATDSQTLRFLESLGQPERTSMAALQGYLKKYKNDPEKAIHNAKEVFETIIRAA